MGRLTLVLGVALTMVSMTLSDAIGDWAVDSGGREHRKAEAAIRYFTEVIKSTEITRKNLKLCILQSGQRISMILVIFDRAILNFSQALQLNTDADRLLQRKVMLMPTSNAMIRPSKTILGLSS